MTTTMKQLWLKLMNINFPTQALVNVHPCFLLHCFMHYYNVCLNKAMINTVYEDRMGSIFEIPNYEIQDRNTARNSKKKPLGKHYHAGT